MEKKTYTTMIGDTDLTLEVGKLAPKADVSVLGRMGDTVMMTTVCVGGESNLGYFPLSVEYVEKLYAGGRIKGSRWVKREGKPTDDAVLKGRVIDRSIRPLFPKGYKRDVQVVTTLLSTDGEHSSDILAAITVSAALHLSQIPWNGPISTMRVGYVSQGDDKSFIINPAEDVQEYSKLDLVVSSTENKVVMIETQAEELPEELIAEGIKHAHTVNKDIVAFINKMRDEIGKPKQDVPSQDTMDEIKALLKKDYDKEVTVYTEKNAANDDDAKVVFDDLVDTIAEQNEGYERRDIASAIEARMLDIVREKIFNNGERLDGRKLDEIRPLSAETNLLPRTHGSSLFNRGLTQVMAVATLGGQALEQLIESPEGEETKTYMHHYFSPPYSYGDTGRMGWPGRREIGHGALAEKAVEPVLPSRESFPYAIRVASEVLSSNGSTSMASTCASSMALMDAGVPIKAAVGGISIGLMFKSDDDYTLLTDIAGIEDFAGHMDFKVAGTREGVTAIQLDVKNDGLTGKMITETFDLAKTARMQVLDVMDAAVSEPRKDLSEYAPKVVTLNPPADKIGEIIGPGGKNIKRVIAETGTDINISDDGVVTITGVDPVGLNKAEEAIKNVYKVIKPGEIYPATVRRILPIGAMVEFLPGREGLVHISKLGKGFIKNVEDVVSEGDDMHVKVLEIDDRGRVNLGKVTEDGEDDFEARPSGGGGNRGGGDRRGGYRGDRDGDDDRRGGRKGRGRNRRNQ